MKKFDMLNAMLNWQNVKLYIPESKRRPIRTLVGNLIEDAVKKHMKTSIVHERIDNLYWDKDTEQYVEPEEIIDTAIFEMWE